MGTHFLLSFGTTLGRTRTFRVNNVNMAVTNAIVSNSMSNMISSQAIDGPSGRINSPRRASLIETRITPIELV